jgi:hypothetical protein
MEITLPTIHLNGTGAQTLKEGYDNAAEKLEDFADAFSEIEFHPRDYYVRADAYSKALQERQEMARKIKEVQDYLNKIREHLYCN